MGRQWNKHITYTKIFFDFKSAYILLPQQENKITEGAANEQRQNGFYSNQGIPSSVSISEMRRQIQRRWTCKARIFQEPPRHNVFFFIKRNSDIRIGKNRQTTPYPTHILSVLRSGFGLRGRTSSVQPEEKASAILQKMFL
jgi:hypothetical protein